MNSNSKYFETDKPCDDDVLIGVTETVGAAIEHK